MWLWVQRYLLYILFFIDWINKYCTLNQILWGCFARLLVLRVVSRSRSRGMEWLTAWQRCWHNFLVLSCFGRWWIVSKCPQGPHVGELLLYMLEHQTLTNNNKQWCMLNIQHAFMHINVATVVQFISSLHHLYHSSQLIIHSPNNYYLYYIRRKPFVPRPSSLSTPLVRVILHAGILRSRFFLDHKKNWLYVPTIIDKLRTWRDPDAAFLFSFLTVIRALGSPKTDLWKVANPGGGKVQFVSADVCPTICMQEHKPLGDAARPALGRGVCGKMVVRS